MDNKLVPVKKTSLYKLIENFSQGRIKETTTWTDLGMDGNKPFLTCRDFKDLVYRIKTKTTGGVALSVSEVREEILASIKKSFQRRNILHPLPEHSIPM